MYIEIGKFKLNIMLIFFLVLLGMAFIFGNSNAIYEIHSNVSSAFIDELVAQIIEMDDVVNENLLYDDSEADADSEKLRRLAFRDGMSNEEEDLLDSIEKMRVTVKQIESATDTDIRISKDDYITKKLVMMYELKSKRKTYTNLNALWEKGIFVEPNN